MRGLAALALLAACAKDPGGPDDGRVYVVATTGMVADLARNIGRDLVHVEALMGPGVDPHLYRASQGDLTRLRKADLVLYNGLHLEGRMTSVLKKLARKKPVVAVGEYQSNSGGPRVDRLIGMETQAGHHDPHIWFDVHLWASACPPIASALAKLLPESSNEIHRRATEYMNELKKLDSQVREALSAIPKSRRVLITSHDAFRYMGKAYDMEVKGVQGISTVSDAGIKDIEDMAEFIVRRGVKAIFVESSVNPRAIEAVQRAVHAKGGSVRIGGTLYSDAMGDKPPEDTYFGMVRANVRAIVEALR